MPPDRGFLLMGSGEFEPWSAEVERAALDGRADPTVLIVPTASAPEGDEVFDRWARTGLEHYGRAGLAARVVPIKTREDAEREDLARELDDAAMVFFSGGDPRHLAAVLDGTRFGDALVAALERGTVFAGCSAGAIVASQSRDQRKRLGAGSAWVFGLGLVPHVSFGALGQDAIRPRDAFVRGFEGAEGVVVRRARRADGHRRRRRRVEGLRPGNRVGPSRRSDAGVSGRRDLRDEGGGPGRERRVWLSLRAVSSTDESPVAPDAARPGCFLCGRPTFDPDKRERPWVRATVSGRQVLVCPRCQEERPDWAVQLDRCESCGATRLSVTLGEVVCRECGFVRGASPEPASLSGA